MDNAEDAQGSELTWGPFTFKRMKGFSVSGGGVVMFDKTNMSSTILGSGANARIVKQLDPVAVEPMTLNASGLGVQSFSVTDRGRVEDLSLTFPSGGVSGPAALVDFSVEGAVGELIQTSMSFRFTG